ncbi:hypothetical protein IF188_17190 [Microbacterium sp. NEAU-LLC]|uniref:Uncharacterized protein n=1 Tax=Microbacterium helvum TaxID=2773713 RepID=A0ABR8NS17_9MICO|nr:hypothetical protein [Microbacterium helvum]MBD3943429.1 hypothetical protein [Microbacterium helvum]
MEWTGDTAAGDWLRQDIDQPWRGTMNDIVPRGFEGYARVFHRSTRERPVGRPWPAEPYERHRAEWDAVMHGDIDVEPARWADAAAAFGTTMHAGAQWNRLVRGDFRARGVEPLDGDGWRYSEPREGCLDPESVAALAAVAAEYTTTPDDAYVAVWEGWGGLVGSFGPAPTAALAVSEPQLADNEMEWVSLEEHHRRMLGFAVTDPFNNVFRKPVWRPGRLSDEISRAVMDGARLDLPGRPHVLFRARLDELATPEWATRVPWADQTPEWTASPSWIWPSDHAFAIASEIDWDSTIVAGSNAFVRAVCAHPGLEALPIREGTMLTWDSDDLNR